jgi:hypothetical protein
MKKLFILLAYMFCIRKAFLFHDVTIQYVDRHVKLSKKFIFFQNIKSDEKQNELLRQVRQ